MGGRGQQLLFHLLTHLELLALFLKFQAYLKENNEDKIKTLAQNQFYQAHMILIDLTQFIP